MGCLVDRSLPVWVLAALALVLLLMAPLGWLGYMSVSSETGATLSHYREVFTDPHLQKALWNTVVLAFWVGLASLAIGSPIAWLTARTDLPGKRLVRGLILASFVTPPFLGAFAWVMLAGPNAGLLNKLYRAWTGAEDPLVNVFSMPGLIFVVSIYTFPYVFIMIANTLELIASDLEEAASILGASRLWVALTVTLPMVAPAILSGFILSVLQALALFGSPAILALPAGFHTITTQIWALFQYPPKVEMAAAFSVPLLLATALLLFLQKRLLGRRGYAAVGGKGGQRRQIALGPWRQPALLACLAVMACAIFLPYGILAKAAFSRAWAQPLTWDNVTLGNWSFTFLSVSTQTAIVNTLELGILTACVGAGLATLLAYITNRRLIVGHQLLAFLALAPVVIPGVVLAVGLFIAYTRPPSCRPFAGATCWERARRADRASRAVPGVSIRGLHKRYGDVAAVDGLDLDVKPGELVALLGPSGCGKTTTLRVVAGFLSPDSGEVWVGDRCLSSPATVIPPERRRMGMIFQSYALWPHMTVAQNVGYGLRFSKEGRRGVPRTEREAKVTEML